MVALGGTGYEPVNDYISAARSRKALPMTDTELRLMAAAAIMGLSKMPNTGKSTPAAIGIPTLL